MKLVNQNDYTIIVGSQFPHRGPFMNEISGDNKNGF